MRERIYGRRSSRASILSCQRARPLADAAYSECELVQINEDKIAYLAAEGDGVQHSGARRRGCFAQGEEKEGYEGAHSHGCSRADGAWWRPRLIASPRISKQGGGCA